MKPANLYSLWQSLLVTTKYPGVTKGRRIFYNSLVHGLLKLMGRKHQKMLEKAHQQDTAYRKSTYDQKNKDLAQKLCSRHHYRMTGNKADPGVKYLDDPYLSHFRLVDFPRLQPFLDRYFNEMPEICPERPQLLTKWFRENGFETQAKDTPWIPELRQAHAFAYLMAGKQPIIRKNDLVAGTTTTNDNIGVVIYPDAQGVMAWGELGAIEKRMLNPYRITDETAHILHHGQQHRVQCQAQPKPPGFPGKNR